MFAQIEPVKQHERNIGLPNGNSGKTSLRAPWRGHNLQVKRCRSSAPTIVTVKPVSPISC